MCTSTLTSVLPGRPFYLVKIFKPGCPVVWSTAQENPASSGWCIVTSTAELKKKTSRMAANYYQTEPKSGSRTSSLVDDNRELSNLCFWRLRVSQIVMENRRRDLKILWSDKDYMTDRPKC